MYISLSLISQYDTSSTSNWAYTPDHILSMPHYMLHYQYLTLGIPFSTYSPDKGISIPASFFSPYHFRISHLPSLPSAHTKEKRIVTQTYPITRNIVISYISAKHITIHSATNHCYQTLPSHHKRNRRIMYLLVPWICVLH